MRSAASPLRDLASAVEWARGVWDDLTPPARIHSAGPGDDRWGAPDWSPAMSRYMDLAEHPMAARVRVVSERDCYHPALQRTEPIEHCPACGGSGHVRKRSLLHDSPIRAAMERLRAADRADGTDFTGIVLTLSRAGWDPTATSLPAPILLRALRRLERRYMLGPVPSRRALSESQSIAEHGETAVLV